MRESKRERERERARERDENTGPTLRTERGSQACLPCVSDSAPAPTARVSLCEPSHFAPATHRWRSLSGNGSHRSSLGPLVVSRQGAAIQYRGLQYNTGSCNTIQGAVILYRGLQHNTGGCSTIQIQGAVIQYRGRQHKTGG